MPLAKKPTHPRRATAVAPARPPGDGAAPAGGRAYIGLALLGWGLAILLGVTPHEDRLVGAALAAFGGLLLATAPAWPRVPPVDPRIAAAAGLLLATGVLGYVVLAGAALDARKVALVALGAGLACAAPWLGRTVRLPRHGATATVGSLVACAAVALGAPLAVWAVQAAFKAAIGATPLEAFVRVGLLAPLHAILTLLGLSSSVRGQSVTYATRDGPLQVDVGAACSGLQAMALFTAVLGLYVLVERPGGRRLALWCAIGIAGVYAANVLRLVAIFLVGYQWGGDALVRVHAQAGWVFFVAWALLFARLVPTSRRGARRAA